MQDFVNGKKTLEIDEREYFRKVKNKGFYKSDDYSGIYPPAKINFPGKEEGQIILSTQKKRELPLESKLSSELIKIHSMRYTAFEEISLHYLSKIKIIGIEDLYYYASKNHPKLPKFIPSADLRWLQKEQKFLEGLKI